MSPDRGPRSPHSPRRRRRAAVAPLAVLAVAWPLTSLLLGTPEQVVTSAAPAVEAGAGVRAPGLDTPLEVPASLSPPVRSPLDVVGGTSLALLTPAGSSSTAPGDIPAPALAAYQRAESIINAADAGCRISWQLVAALGSVESDHGRFGGSVLDDQGRATPAILGPVLDGGPGLATIRDTDAGQYDADDRFDRAVGPLQFIPSTWALAGVDADDDGRRDPQDIDDAALAAAVYLCSGTEDLSTVGGQEAAVHRYNHSDSYVDLVLARARAYLDGDVVSVGGYGSVVDAGLVTSSGTTSPPPAAVLPTARPGNRGPAVASHWMSHTGAIATSAHEQVVRADDQETPATPVATPVAAPQEPSSTPVTPQPAGTTPAPGGHGTGSAGPAEEPQPTAPGHEPAPPATPAAGPTPVPTPAPALTPEQVLATCEDEDTPPEWIQENEDLCELVLGDVPAPPVGGTGSPHGEVATTPPDPVPVPGSFD